MKQTKNVTLSLRKDVADLLKQYADVTRQSQSRAVSELIIAAANEKGVYNHETGRQVNQS
jgi:hypothetical protein